MKNFLLILVLLIIFSCQSKTNSENNIETVFPDKKYGTETKVFGDSLKIIYEYKGDTVIQKRIDLKGTSDDNFDSSFNIVSIWSTQKVSKLDCTKYLKLNHDEVNFNFCLNDVISKVDNDILKYSDKTWKIENLEKLKKDLLNIKNGNSEKLTERTYYLIFDLIREINFSAFDNKTKSDIEKIRIEEYETNFSGGNNYYLINKKKDTIARFTVNHWIS
ncbi:hypothetical protein [Winogradskyella ouciana]|uniref:hypothetical protein n=1 Tax=Winogradskyella ouciana TaxID=2608631 RepID=UPI003D2966FB